MKTTEPRFKPGQIVYPRITPHGPRWSKDESLTVDSLAPAANGFMHYKCRDATGAIFLIPQLHLSSKPIVTRGDR